MGGPPWHHGPPHCFPHCGPHHHWDGHHHWEVLAEQDNSTENASDVNLSAEAGWGHGPFGHGPGPWGHPWGHGPPWHHGPPHCFPHCGPHHWEVLAKQENSTDSANQGDVSPSVETTASSTGAPRRLRRCSRHFREHVQFSS